MKNTLVLITILLIFLVGILTFLAVNILGKEPSNEDNYDQYTYTKAICTESYCQDYIIACKGPKITSMTPITGAIIDISPNWEDPRPQKQIDTWCE